VGHLECENIIGANHNGAVVTMVERKGGYAVMTKVAKNISVG
jgi:IS30 family transposase